MEGRPDTQANTARSCRFSFSWMNTTTQSRSLEKVMPEVPRRKTAASRGKRCRWYKESTFVCKSFIQCFWELNLCCYKYRIDCFGSFLFAPVILLLLLSESSRNITKHLMSDPSGNHLVLFSLESWCFPRLRLGKHQDSRENKTNCFPWDLTLSV